MAVNPGGINPSWHSAIPRQDLYPGQTVRINLRNYQSRQDATITILPVGNPPSWVTIHEDGTTKEIVIAAPVTETGGESYTIDLNASAFVNPPGTTVNRQTALSKHTCLLYTSPSPRD